MRTFGDLESLVMDRLWNADRPATVREMLDTLASERQLAYTTVMTVMDNLYRKGWLTRELDGKAYRYQPVSSRRDYSAELMRQVLAGSGDEVATLLRFVDSMTDQEASAVRDALLDRRRADDHDS
ncbi:BlaI/MecI/CopY family transcriptional regulator [Kribbella antibiotica]|uniref:BlaI/MecI/CopY family transcriptional regulator n=1 Tax=Kribbella antibiotica TaxID=190195 RepID=A0A4V2YQ80_9ACTN|nr:BlaI/MecI/CopY family transcriptional regulator [Kribbella antibiotica]TDD61057.1 BlaI/MecI/CopY family transcriptional regulator [Kribbella antibiotica]